MYSVRHRILLVLTGVIVLSSSSVLAATPDGLALCTAAGGQEQPASISDGDGGAIVVWVDRRNVFADIFAQRLNAAGIPQWTANGIPVCTAAGEQGAPTLAPDGEGGAIIAWEDAGGNTFDIYAQHVSAAGVPLWPAYGNPICSAANDQRVPCIVSDAAGGAIVAWYDKRRGMTDVYDIYTQRVNGAGVRQWIADGVAICTAGGVDVFPSIASDDSGGAIVAWDDGRNGSANQDTYAQRIDASGVPRWVANGRAVCSAPGIQGGSVIVADGAGGAILAWVDGRVHANDIYAQRLDATGVQQWSANGVPLCTSTFNLSPAITSDGASGAVVTWEDRHDQPNFGIIRAQRVSGAGVAQWIPNGMPLSDVVGGQRWPAIAPDHAEGAIIAWEDFRGGTGPDIYAQRVTGAGTLLWDLGGRAVCTAPGGQYFFGSFDYRTHHVTSDGVGGAFAAWVDGRDDPNGDIYAQRVRLDGAILAVPVSALHTEVAEAVPNPFRERVAIAFSLLASSSIRVDVFDLAGRCVRKSPETLLGAGPHLWEWDGRGDDGARESGGVYFLRLRGAGVMTWRRVVRLN